MHALLGDFAHFTQREHLEAAGVGEDWFIPLGKVVEVAVGFDHIGAGAQPEVKGVAQDDLGANLFDRLGRHALDRAVGADRHERRGFHRATGEVQTATTRAAILG